MKALVKSRAEPGLWLEDVPEPEIGINDVLIRVNRSGICGTDIHIHRWDAWAQRTILVPLVVGHEFVGEIVDVGSNVSDLRLGDRRMDPRSPPDTLRSTSSNCGTCGALGGVRDAKSQPGERLASPPTFTTLRV